jgi:starvation-inducible DNA-binding protein
MSAEVGKALQASLLELIALSLIGKQFHWNICGPGFRELHLQLDEYVESWANLADTVAERAAAIGFAPDGRPSAVEASDLEAVEEGPIGTAAARSALYARLEGVSERVTSRLAKVGDLDLASQDVLIEVTRELDKHLWMLRAELQSSSG